MSTRSPAVASWELALRIRLRREQLGLEPAAVATATGTSRSYWGLIETERRIPAVDKLKALLELLEFDSDEQRELLELRTRSKERGWWERYSALFSAELLRLYGLEHGAQTIRAYESIVIPWLLQTEEYARAIISADPNIREVEIDQRVETRMRRQQWLKVKEPRSFTAIIGEAALMHQTGSSEILKHQLLHIAEVAETHNDIVEVRVIPFTASGGNTLGGATFHLLDFESPQLPTLAWHESAVFGEVIEDATEHQTRVRDLGFVFGKAKALALSSSDSLTLIRQKARS